MRKYKPLQTAALAATTALVACSLVAPAIAWGSEAYGPNNPGPYGDVRPTGDVNYGEDTFDVISTNSNTKGSITIHKYDSTAMGIDGINYQGVAANGEVQSVVENGTTQSVTSAWSQYAIQGVEFTILKVADIATYTNGGGDVQVLYGFSDPGLYPLLGLGASDAVAIDNPSNLKGDSTLTYFNSQTINTKFAGVCNDTSTKNNLETYVGTHSGISLLETDDSGMTTATNLDLGLYLVVETKVPEDVISTTSPFLVSLPMTSANGDSWFYDVNVYPKNQTGYPTITKRVADADDSELLTGTAANGTNTPYGDTCTASGGDTLNMRIIVRLPEISSDATKLTEWKIVDQQPGGIAYTQSDVYVKFYASEEKALAGEDPVEIPGGTQWKYAPNSPSSYFDVSWPNPINGVSSMVVNLKPQGLAAVNGDMESVTNQESPFSGRYMVVYYTSMVESNAGMAGGLVLGDTGGDTDGNDAALNNCPATLSWKRANTTYEDHISTSVRVFSYGIDLTKAFSDKTDITALAQKVEFTLRNVSQENWYGNTQSDNYYVKATPVAEQAGEYEVIEGDGATGTNPTEAADATRFQVAANGTLKIYGLEGGTYELVEVATADGYSLLKQPITIVINETVGVVTDELYSDRATANNNSETATSPKLPTLYAYAMSSSANSTVDNNTATMVPDPVVPSSANALVTLRITNNPSFLLPQTGGAGMWAITIVGVAGVGLGAALLIRSRKSDDKK